MTEQTLTALYDTQGAAAAARDEMLKLKEQAGYQAGMVIRTTA